MGEALPSHPDPKQPLSLEREPLPLEMLFNGHKRLIVAGDLASGRSTLLAYLALAHAQPDLAAVHDLDATLMPLYVPLTAMDWSIAAPVEGDDEQEEQPAPAEEEQPGLERLVQTAIRATAAPSAAAKLLTQRLQEGTALLLLDGWDELNDDGREQAASWLADLADEWPGNTWLVVAGSCDLAPLTDAQFAPLRLTPWNREQVASFAARLATKMTADDEQAAPELDPDMLPKLEKEPSLLDLALRVWLLLDEGTAPPGRMYLFMHALERLLNVSEETTWLPPVARAVLGNLAFVLQEESRATVSKKELVNGLVISLESNVKA